MNLSGLLDALDHPIVFLFLLTIGVLGMAAIIGYLAHKGNMGGLYLAVKG